MLIGEMLALHLMKTHVVRATLETTLAGALDLMDLYQVSTLPVVDSDGQLLGALSEGDIIRRLAAAALLNNGSAVAEAAAESVARHMSVPAISVPETMELREAAELVLRRNLKRVPVLAENGHVIGTLSRIDICQALVEGVL